MRGLPGQPPGDRVVELQRAASHLSPARPRTRHHRPSAGAIRRRRFDALAPRGADAALPAPDGWRSARRPRRCGSRRPACAPPPATAGGIGHAVEVAADAHHAVAGDAALQPQHRPERASGSGRRCGRSSAKASLTTRRVVAWTAGWRPRPASSELGVQILEIAEGRARKKSSRM